MNTPQIWHISGRTERAHLEVGRTPDFPILISFACGAQQNLTALRPAHPKKDRRCKNCRAVRDSMSALNDWGRTLNKIKTSGYALPKLYDTPVDLPDPPE